MSKVTSKIASYLSVLNPGEYSIQGPIAGAVNYLLDSYFAKTDERYLLAQQNREYEPPDLESHIRESWLGCDIHKTFSLNRGFPGYLRAQVAWAFTRLFRNFIGEGAPYEIVPYMDFYQYKEYLKSSYFHKTQSAQLEIAFGQNVTLPVFGTFFVSRTTDNKKLVLNVDLAYDSMGCSIKIQVAPEDQDVAEQFFSDLSHSIFVNDIYRNKCLTFDSGILGFQKLKDTTWDDVIIKPDLKERIQNNSVGILKNLETLSSLGGQISRNCLLISPPGMAKTTMFRAISNDLEGDITRIWCTGKSIEYADHVTCLFEAARDLAPCIVFIEDMDLFGTERTANGGRNYVLNEFLTQLDGTGNNAGVVVLASTNDFKSMDEALTNRPGRFNDKIKIPLPDEGERNVMLLKFLKDCRGRRGRSITPEIWSNIISLTDGFTGDYIKELANTAIINSVNQGRVMGNTVILEADDLVKASERVLENYTLGKESKSHTIEISKD